MFCIRAFVNVFVRFNKPMKFFKLCIYQFLHMRRILSHKHVFILKFRKKICLPFVFAGFRDYHEVCKDIYLLIYVISIQPMAF